MSWLKFGNSHIRVGNVDALFAVEQRDGLFVVERAGRFLFIETKAPHEALPVGQERLLKELSYLERFTVVLLEGPKSWPEKMERFYFGGRYPRATNREQFQGFVDRWFATAEGEMKDLERRHRVGRERLRPCALCSSTLATVASVLCTDCLDARRA